METPLKPLQFFCEWIPGAVLAVLILGCFQRWDWSETIDSMAQHSLIVFPAFALAALVVGQLIDSLRDLAWEYFADRFLWRKFKGRVNWDFFFSGADAEIRHMEDYYFSYYSFNLNISIALVLSILLTGVWGWLHHFGLPVYLIATRHALRASSGHTPQEKFRRSEQRGLPCLYLCRNLSESPRCQRD